jgi:hypothetical protein
MVKKWGHFVYRNLLPWRKKIYTRDKTLDI